jgi:hypothetical protein
MGTCIVGEGVLVMCEKNSNASCLFIGTEGIAGASDMEGNYYCPPDTVSYIMAQVVVATLNVLKSMKNTPRGM